MKTILGGFESLWPNTLRAPEASATVPKAALRRSVRRVIVRVSDILLRMVPKRAADTGGSQPAFRIASGALIGDLWVQHRTAVRQCEPSARQSHRHQPALL